MVAPLPAAELDHRYGDDDAIVTPWEAAVDDLMQAEIYWLTTLRPDGRPHLTPVIGIWSDEGFHFATGPAERKTRNLEQNPNCIVLTGCNLLNEGLDLVIEGQAERVRDEALLRDLAAAYSSKYEGWHFDVRDGAFLGEGGVAYVFRVAPAVGFGFGRSPRYSQTRWSFKSEDRKS